MSIKNIKIRENNLHFQINHRDTSIANTIRRVISAHMPIYAADTSNITVKENNSIFHAERLAHIIELIPILNFRKELNYDDVTFSIDEEFKVDGVVNKKLIVMSDNIESSDGLSYFMPGMPIVELRNNQRLKLENIKLKIGILKEHARHQSSIVRYKVLNIDESIKGEPTNIEMVVEPCGVSESGEHRLYPLSPIDVMSLSLEVLINKLKSLKKNIPNININIDKKIGLAKCMIDNEDHTICNSIVCFIRSTKEFSKRYCGYRIPHPLKNIAEIGMTHDNPIDVIGNAIDKLVAIYENILAEFNKFVNISKTV